MKIPEIDGMKSFVHCSGDKCPWTDEKQTRRIENQLQEDPKVTDPILLFGFPQEGADFRAVEPFARSGIVAYGSREATLKIEGRVLVDKEAFVVDAFAWPGNSGGPVVQQPLPLSGAVRLFGLVTGAHAPIPDYSIVTPVSRIKETFEHARQLGKLNTAAWENREPVAPVSCPRPNTKASQQ